MRAPVLVLVLLLGCAGPGSGGSCPSSLQDRAACAFADRCWRENTFSSCASGWCRCEAGTTVCDAIEDGAPCGDEPITSCEVEGNPSCTTLPTSGACSCGSDGRWHCSCACYGGTTTCEVDPCSLPIEQLRGARCAQTGEVCTYPGNVTCTCEAGTAGGDATFRCP